MYNSKSSFRVLFCEVYACVTVYIEHCVKRHVACGRVGTDLSRPCRQSRMLKNALHDVGTDLSRPASISTGEEDVINRSLQLTYHDYLVKSHY